MRLQQGCSKAAIRLQQDCSKTTTEQQFGLESQNAKTNSFMFVLPSNVAIYNECSMHFEIPSPYEIHPKVNVMISKCSF